MVTGVLNDSTNQPKGPKIRSQSQPESKEPLAVARTLFGAEKKDSASLPMPKALTASLPTFEGKSVKFERSEDFFRNNIKMYPQSRNLKKSTTSTRCSEETFCNIEDSKKDSLDKIMAIFKRRFGDYMSMAKTVCEWDSLKFDPST